MKIVLARGEADRGSTDVIIRRPERGRDARGSHADIQRGSIQFPRDVPFDPLFTQAECLQASRTLTFLRLSDVCEIGGAGTVADYGISGRERLGGLK